MKRNALLFGSTLAFASLSSAQLFRSDDGPEQFDTLVYFFSGALEITGGAVYDHPAGERIETPGDVVGFDYTLTDGPGQWIERIHDIEYRSITYQITDPARLADRWKVDPKKTFLGSSLSAAHATPAWFEAATGTDGGLNFAVRFGTASYVFGDEYYVLNVDLGDSGSELKTASISFYEAVIAGLLAGETVTIEVSPQPYFSGAGIVSPYAFAFPQFNVAAELFIPEGVTTVIPEPSAAPSLLSFIVAVYALRRRQRS